jgi:hypothetical protein
MVGATGGAVSLAPFPPLALFPLPAGGAAPLSAARPASGVPEVASELGSFFPALAARAGRAAAVSETSGKAITSVGSFIVVTP